MANLVVLTPASGPARRSTACSTGSSSLVLCERKLFGFFQLVDPDRQFGVATGSVEDIDGVDVDIRLPQHPGKIAERTRTICHGHRENLPLIEIGVNLLKLGPSGLHVAGDQFDHPFAIA